MFLMNLGIPCRAIDEWPGELTTDRVKSPFSASWADTYKILARETSLLGTTTGVLMLAYDEYDIRPDGGIKAKARPEHPGVILNLETEHGPLRMACDRFPTQGDNLRAIGLGLEALRRLERYGISRRGQQYTGWKRLDAEAGPDSNGEMTRGDALATLSAETGLPPAWIATSPDNLKEAYRLAAKRAHPEAGGDPERMRLVNEARAVLTEV